MSDKLCGFRKGFNSQYTLINLLERWKRSLNRNGIGAALLTDLSKAFDCLNHNLLIAKLHAYGFDNSSLMFIQSYLKGRKQRTIVGTSYSSWAEIMAGVPQGSILGTLLFNIYINDLFLNLENWDIANYADGNKPIVCGKSIDEVISHFEVCFCELSECLKLNDDKCHLLVSNHTSGVSIRTGVNTIVCSSSEKLLVIHIENTLKFDAHVSALCKKANQK